MNMQINAKINLKAIDALIISSIAVVYTLAWNWSSPWPVYLSDAVAYLVNAAIIVGYPVDAMGSWHAGYSILLAPLFLMDDPFWVWKGVQIVNAFLVGLAIYLSAALIDQLRPDMDRWSRSVCLAVLVLYPAFSAIAGWGFSSSILSANVLLIGLILAKSSTLSVRYSILLGALAGFAYWIHPTGLVVILATLVAMVVRMRTVRWVPLLAALTMSVVMVVCYKYGVHEAMYRIATPEGFGRYDHYQDVSFRHLLTREGIIRFLALFGGQLSYQLVSTLGLAALGIWVGVTVVMRWRTHRVDLAEQENKWSAVAIFAVLLVAGTIGAITLAESGSTLTRTDYWIYGRYTDAVVHPLLTIGLLTYVNGKINIKSYYYIWVMSVIFILAVGGYLHLIVDTKLPHSYQSTLAYWPQYLIQNRDYLYLMVLGASGVVSMALFSGAQKSVMLAAPIFLFVGIAWISGKHNHAERQRLESNYSQPSALVNVVRETWPRGSCVGFAQPMLTGLSMMQRERNRMYAFLLFNYGYRRYTLENWKRECSGPLLTFDPVPIISDPDLKIVLREQSTGLLLVSRKAAQVKEPSMGQDGLGEIDFLNDFSKKCFVAGCFSMKARQLSKFSQVGSLNKGYLRTSGNAGYLFFGPYRRLGMGDYEVELEIDINNVTDAVLDVVSAAGKTTHVSMPMNTAAIENGKAKMSFSLAEAADNLEVRLRVGRNDIMSVAGYKIRFASRSGGSPTIH